MEIPVEFVLVLSKDLKPLVQQDLPTLLLMSDSPFKGFSHPHVTNHP